MAQDRVAQGKKPTTCTLHAQELVLKHGLGLLARVLPDKMKDTFKEGVKLKAKVKALASKVMDKKAKGRYQDYVRVANLISPCTPNKLALPNSTRVSGVFLLFTSVLHARWALNAIDRVTETKDVYTRELMLEPWEWQMLAEFEAVMQYTHTLAMLSQTSYHGEIAFSWLNVCECRWSHLDEDEDLPIKCVDIYESIPCGTKRDEIPEKN